MTSTTTRTADDGVIRATRHWSATSPRAATKPYTQVVVPMPLAATAVSLQFGS